LREERKLRVSENMVLRGIFGPREDEVPEEWRRLHNEELNDLCSSTNIVRVIKSRRMRWAGYVARMGEERGVYRVLVGKAEGKRRLGRPRHRWVDNIRMDLQEVGCGYMQLKAIPPSDYQRCYEEWEQRLRRCVASQGNYFEGDKLDL